MLLFHEIYSSYYLATASILREAVRGTLTGKELNALVQQHAFGESILTIPEGLKGEKWRLLHHDLTTPLKSEPSMPMTMLEKRWLKTLLLDPRIQLFEPCADQLEDVEPLFTPDMLVYYDRYTDGDDYKNPDYIRNFRTILQALRDSQNLYIEYESKHHGQKKVVVTPYYLEYSEKDDVFRLVAAEQTRGLTINLSRISRCGKHLSNERFPLPPPNSASVTFELEDVHNAMERVLLHFSHLQKETRRLDENHYRVTLHYNLQDEKEIVIRILSFGAAIKVVEPKGFIDQLVERIENQKALMSEFS